MAKLSQTEAIKTFTVLWKKKNVPELGDELEKAGDELEIPELIRRFSKFYCSHANAEYQDVMMELSNLITYGGASIVQRANLFRHNFAVVKSGQWIPQAAIALKTKDQDS